tara:strand:+ start:468 stop:620 length:153 start_codon:yes stop_codon:yes gene_type:complete
MTQEELEELKHCTSKETQEWREKHKEWYARQPAVVKKALERDTEDDSRRI